MMLDLSELELIERGSAKGLRLSVDQKGLILDSPESAGQNDYE
jgi:hypothetical protein